MNPKYQLGQKMYSFDTKNGVKCYEIKEISIHNRINSFRETETCIIYALKNEEDNYYEEFCEDNSNSIIFYPTRQDIIDDLTKHINKIKQNII